MQRSCCQQWPTAIAAENSYVLQRRSGCKQWVRQNSANHVGIGRSICTAIYRIYHRIANTGVYTFGSHVGMHIGQRDHCNSPTLQRAPHACASHRVPTLPIVMLTLPARRAPNHR